VTKVPPTELVRPVEFEARENRLARESASRNVPQARSLSDCREYQPRAHAGIWTGSPPAIHRQPAAARAGPGNRGRLTSRPTPVHAALSSAASDSIEGNHDNGALLLEVQRGILEAAFRRRRKAAPRASFTSNQPRQTPGRERAA